MSDTIKKPHWEPLSAIHEEGFPYLVWHIDHPTDVELYLHIDDYEEYLHPARRLCMSLKRFFLTGYQTDVDAAMGAE